MISHRHPTNQMTTGAMRNAVVLSVSASVMGWWWSGNIPVGQP